jgi:hypothetical protein
MKGDSTVMTDKKIHTITQAGSLRKSISNGGRVEPRLVDATVLTVDAIVPRVLRFFLHIVYLFSVLSRGQLFE